VPVFDAANATAKDEAKMQAHILRNVVRNANNVRIPMVEDRFVVGWLSERWRAFFFFAKVAPCHWFA